MITTGKNRIMIYGPKTDGTYVVEFQEAEGEALAVSKPRTETAVIGHFQKRIPTDCRASGRGNILALGRPRRERPCGRAAEQRNELAPIHSIASSAATCSVCGKEIPSALAVLRFMSSRVPTGRGLSVILHICSTFGGPSPSFSRCSNPSSSA
jgi:hypothetical protein